MVENETSKHKENIEKALMQKSQCSLCDLRTY